MSPAHATHDFARNALVGAVVPVFFAVVNQWLTAAMVHSYNRLATIQACAAVLVELVCFGWLCVKFVQPRLQGFAYLWLWALFDWVTIPLATDGVWWGYPLALMLPAMLSVQLGVVVVWAVFGQMAWPVRWPVSATALFLGITLPLAIHQHGTNQVAVLIAAQTTTLFIVCMVVRWRGVKLIRGDNLVMGNAGGDAPALEEIGAPQDGQMRFALWHVILWMTVIAVILSLVRALELLLPSHIFYDRRGTRFLLATGFLAGLIWSAAFVAMLSARQSVWRWSLVLAIMLATPVVLPAFYFHYVLGGSFFSGAIFTGPFVGRAYWQFFYTHKWALVAWIPLASLTFAVSLLFHRMLGFRLCRVSRPR